MSNSPASRHSPITSDEGKNESKPLFSRSMVRKWSRPPISRISFSDILHSFIRSYRLQSYINLILSITYHIFHLSLIFIVLISPLTLRSFLFHDTDNANNILTFNDIKGTKVSSIWELDATHIIGKETWSQKPSLVNISYKNTDESFMNITNNQNKTNNSDPFFLWKTSPISLLACYYFYMITSILTLVIITRGRITGHISLLQLIFGGIELIWYIRSGSSSFKIFLWLAKISSFFPSPWVPFIKQYPNGDITYHVFERNKLGSKSFPLQEELKPEIYMIPYANFLNISVFIITTIFIIILIMCFAINFQRVLDAIIGVQELDTAIGCHRCPLCGEEWEISAEVSDDDEEENNNNNNNNNNNKEFNLAKFSNIASAVTPLRSPCSPHHHFRRKKWRQHRCRKLFLDKEFSSSVFEMTLGNSTFSDSYLEGGVHDDNNNSSNNSNNNSDNDNEEEDNEAELRAAAALAAVGWKKRKPRRKQMNRSFVMPPSYGSIGIEQIGERALYDPFTDKEDEFRPGNAFSSLEDANILSKLTYSWLNPLMNFSVMDAEVLRHERFLPSLPEEFTSLGNIAAPAWQLWVNRWQWFHVKSKSSDNNGGNVGFNDSEFGDRTNNNNNNNNNSDDDDDDSSDDKTYVTISQRRPLTGAKLRPKRPKRSFHESTFRFFTAPLRWVLSKLFIFLFLNGGCGIKVLTRKNKKKDEGKNNKKKYNKMSSSNISSVENNSSSFLLNDDNESESESEEEDDGKFDFYSSDIGLFTPFLEHRSGRRFIYKCVPLRIFSDTLILSTPGILFRLITSMERDNSQKIDNAVAMCGILLIVLLTRAILHQEYLSQLYLSSLEATTAIKALVLEKTFALPLAQRTFTEGEVAHLLTVDTSRCSEALQQLHQSWRCPCLATASLYILHLYVGIIPTLAALIVIIILIPLQRITGKNVHISQQQRTARTVNRVELVGEAVTSMRQVKALGVEDIYLNKIHTARQEETRGETSAMEAVAKGACLAEGIGILLTSSCYTAYYLTGGLLTVDTILPALVALNILRNTVNEWPALVTAIPRGFNSLKRIEKYMQQAPDEFLGTWVDLTADWSEKRGTVICQGCSFTWQDDKTKEVPKPVIHNVHMLIKPGELVIVQGPVGSGKSTLLLAILGEVNRCSNIEMLNTNFNINSNTNNLMDNMDNVVSEVGSANTSIASSSTTTRIKCGHSDIGKKCNDGFFVFGRSVYCPETPWLQNDTIRINILADNAYNPRWYQTVIKACALDEDFDIFEKGDAVIIGDKGVQLSTGQQVRVALARALYARADVYVLDNVLSYLDDRLQKHIIYRVFHGILRNKTVILATHIGLSILKPKRIFTVQEDGSVIEESLQQKQLQGNLRHLYADDCEEPLIEDESSELDDEDSNETDDTDDSSNDFNINSHGLTSKRYSNSGINFKRFISFMGPSLFWLILSNIVQHVLQAGRDIWLSLWISKEPISPVGFLLIYFLIGSSAALFTIPRMRLFFHAVRKSINHIHFAAIERMFKAPVSYFDVNGGSTITGIFSRDQETADHSVGESLNDITTSLFQMLSIILFNAVVNPWFILIIPLTILLFQHVVERYLAVARQIRRLENKSIRGPISILHEVLQGAPVIRCLGLKDIIREEYCKAMDVTNMASMIGHMSDCWVNLRLELITVIMTTTAALLGVLFASYIMPPAFAAVAVVSTLYTSNTLLTLCRSVTAFQKQFVSVEQLLGLQEAPEEPFTIITSLQEEIHNIETENNNDNINININNIPTEDELTPYLSDQTQTHQTDKSCDNEIINITGTDKEEYNIEDEIVRSPPALELIDISAKYRESLPYALRRINFIIYNKERIGIVGRSGNGKSTIFNLLLRLVDIIEGRGIYIEGIDTREITYPILRHYFMLVPQHPLIIQGTWRSNLTLGRSTKEELTDELLWSSLKSVKLDNFVKQQGGLDAPLQNEGNYININSGINNKNNMNTRLSPGQRQLLCLARAILHKPKFLLFDELPTTGVAETDKIIRNLLDHELSYCTVLIIAHRVQTLETLCSRVVIVDNGTITQVIEMKGSTKVRNAVKKKLALLVE